MCFIDMYSIYDSYNSIYVYVEMLIQMTYGQYVISIELRPCIL